MQAKHLFPTVYTGLQIKTDYFLIKSVWVFHYISKIRPWEIFIVDLDSFSKKK